MRNHKCVQTALLGLALVLAVSLPAFASYVQVNLTANRPDPNDPILSDPNLIIDPNLVNPWGIAASGTSPFWTSNNGTGVSTLYNGAGQPFPLGNPRVVTIPPAPGSPAGTTSTPTGQVFNSTADFLLVPGTSSSKATFLFDTQDGTIAGWNASSGSSAVIKVDNSASGAVYTGLALATAGGNSFLYAANFSQSRIDVFDAGFAATTLPGGFTDPNLPAGYAPFNIQELGGLLYVAYAKVDPTTGEEEAGPGLGIVDVYDANGNLIRRIATGDPVNIPLNAPWGLALAPANFGDFPNARLVGNFGDGRINAFDATTDAFLGQLTDLNGQPISIQGLWGLRFGNGGTAGPTNELFFTAGINDEEDGLFGGLIATPEPGTLGLFALGIVLLGVKRRWSLPASVPQPEIQQHPGRAGGAASGLFNGV